MQFHHDRKIAMYSWYFPVGASFEVFALTFALMMILANISLSWYWLALVFIYFFTGVGFITFSIIMMSRLKDAERKELENLRKKYCDDS